MEYIWQGPEIAFFGALLKILAKNLPNPHILFRFFVIPMYSADSKPRWPFRPRNDSTGSLAPTRTTTTGTRFSLRARRSGTSPPGIRQQFEHYNTCVSVTTLSAITPHPNALSI